jgi:hypothetical protein
MSRYVNDEAINVSLTALNDLHFVDCLSPSLSLSSFLKIKVRFAPRNLIALRATTIRGTIIEGFPIANEKAALFLVLRDVNKKTNSERK